MRLLGLMVGLWGFMAFGCSGSEPGGDISGSGGSPGTAGALSISATNVFFSGTAKSEAPWPEFSVEVSTRDANNKFTAVPATIQNDKSYVVANISPGEVYIKYTPGISAPYFIVTEARSINLGSNFIGKPDATPIPATAVVALKATGLRAWQLDDELNYYSPTAGGYGTSSTEPDVDATQLEVASADLADANMLDNDQLIWVQQGIPPAANNSADVQYHSALRALKTDATFTSGATTLISGEFKELEQSQTSVNWDLDAHNGFLQDAPSGTAPESVYFDVLAEPGTVTASSTNWYASLGGVHTFNWNKGSHAITWGNPFPEVWEKIGSLSAVARYRITMPGTSRSISLSVGFAQSDTLSVMANAPINPKLSLPRGLKIAGQAADKNLTGVGESPLITWDPPANNPVASYRVQLYRYEAQNGSLKVARIATFVTTKTNIGIPPRILETGKFYSLMVRALNNELVVDPIGAPLRLTCRGSESWNSSAGFSP